MADTPRITFVYGNDEYAIGKRVRELASVFADATEAEVNTTRLDARGMTDEQWMNAVNALPFIARHRVVLLSSPSARFSGRRAKAEPVRSKGANGEAGAEPRPGAESPADRRRRFLQSLEAAPETTRVVISEVVELRTRQDRTAAEKHWLAVWMRKNQQGVEFLAQPPGDSMAGWISREATAQGGAFAREAAIQLAEMVGTDTRQAAQEVTKLLTYVNWKRPVTEADVTALSPLTAAPDVFQMVDALAEGQGGKAQRLLHRLLEIQDEFSTWGMIIRQFRYLLVAREALDLQGGKVQVTEALSAVEARPVAPFVAEKAMKQARGFTMAKLEQIYHRLLEIDEGAKTGRMRLDLALELLVAELGK